MYMISENTVNSKLGDTVSPLEDIKNRIQNYNNFIIELIKKLDQKADILVGSIPTKGESTSDTPMPSSLIYDLVHLGQSLDRLNAVIDRF